MEDVQVILSDQSIITTASTLESQQSASQQQSQTPPQQQQQQQQQQDQQQPDQQQQQPNQQNGDDSPVIKKIEQQENSDHQKQNKKEKELEKNDDVNNDDNNNTDVPKNEKEKEKEKDEEEEDPEKEKERERILKKFEKAQDAILGGVDGQEGFDVYQMCAFLSKQAKFLPLEVMSIVTEEKEATQIDKQHSSHIHTNKRGRTISRHSSAALARRIPMDQRVTKLQYYLCIIRAFAVAALQIWSLVLTMEELLDRAEWCRGTFDISSFGKASSKIVYAGYVALIGVNVMSWINDVKTSGMYAALTDNECILPDLVDQGWLIAGRTINYVVLIFAIWASFLIIYLSETVLDMILNSIAIYFVLELDNMVMSPRDYKQVAAYTDAYHWDIDERVNEYLHRKEQPIIEESRECNLFKILFDIGTWLISATVVTPVIYFTAFIAFCVAPLYFIVCL